ncbi:thromboxane A2 receptor isoform X2 [Electrophorus electricus]|uniref:thromboxane A2 receptor isoform X2 n=1 Tax=Electrophorus electricus TaxID=8005 RepID=UPI0015CFC307|nr:thromboxane A2 receptor isoform X2 [Electrophorus electricus]
MNGIASSERFVKVLPPILPDDVTTSHPRELTRSPLVTMTTSPLLSGSGGNGSVAFCFSGNQSGFNNTHAVASAYFSAIFSVLGLGSNLFAFVVLVNAFRRTHSRSRSSFLLFLGALVVTDFMGLLFTGSIVVFFRSSGLRWMDLDPGCHLCNFMGMTMIFYGLSPLLLGTAMAVERFVGINRPFARSTAMSRSRVCWVVVGIVAMAGCISLLPLLGLGSYHIQNPGSWCFLNIRPEPLDVVFCLVFSLVGLLSLATSFVLNTTSVVTLLRVCCSQDSVQRKRDYEVEMMVQLIFIMLIATICWCPLLIYIMKTVLSASPADPLCVLFYLRMASFNQICDPWIYIIFQAPILRRVERSMPHNPD